MCLPICSVLLSVSQCSILAMDSAMVDPPESVPQADLTDVLPDHTLEYILARVPLFSVGAARCVCKRWQSLTKSSTFLSLRSERQARSESWMYVNGFRFNITDHTSPPATPIPELPDYSWGAGDLAYTMPDTSTTTLLGVLLMGLNSRSGSSQLQYKLFPLDQQVRVTTPLPHPCTLPIVSAVTNLPDGAHKLIVAGGLPSDASKEFLSTVSVFDSSSQSWSPCEDLPVAFRGMSTLRSVSAVVCNRRLYLYHVYSGAVTSLDVVTRRWSKVTTLWPPGTQYCYLALRHGLTLLLVGVSLEKDRFCFRGWNVAAGSLEYSGDSWPVVCHFGSFYPSRSFGPRKSKKQHIDIDEVPVASSSSCRDPLVAISNSFFRRILVCARIIGVFDALLEFSKGVI